MSESPEGSRSTILATRMVRWSPMMPRVRVRVGREGQKDGHL